MNRSAFRTLRHVLVVVTLASGGIASAADVSSPSPSDKGERRGALQACRADAERLCGTVDKGGGRKLACLREHDAQLTPACHDDLAQLTANRKNVAPK